MPIPPTNSSASALDLRNTARARSKPNLGVRFAVAILFSAIAVAAILFLPAGTLHFWQAWAYFAVFILPIMITYLYFLKTDPRMLESRLKSDEQVSEQRLLMRSARLIAVSILLLPGFDYRFDWSRSRLGPQPLWLTWLSMLMVLAGLCAALWVMNVNRFAGATIGVEADQKVITSGPYRIVRHPMYAAGAVLWLFTPLALSSWISLPAFALIVPFCVLRILSEEKVLREQLPGYIDYCQRIRYRLIPLLW
jgi:protein-S-isoprenylcysteine O-methyltransferase Ste14